MKKSLLVKTGLLGVASLFVASAVFIPMISFAATDSVSDDGAAVHRDGLRDDRGMRMMMGPVGTVTAINDSGNGTGTVTMTLLARPVDAPKPERGIANRIRGGIEHFREMHPDAPKAGDSVTISYDATTRFVIGGKELSAADLKVGMDVRVRGANIDSNSPANMITDRLRPISHRGMIGIIKSIDTGSNTFTITLPARNEHSEKTVQINYSDETKFLNKRDTASESVLVVGQKVRVDGDAIRVVVLE